MLALTRSPWSLALLAASIVVTGCGDDTEPATGGGGSPPTTTTGGGGAGGTGGTEEGGGGGTGGVFVCDDPTQGVAFALTQLYFGEGANGQWKSVGMNIDGLESDETSTDLCQPSAGGNPAISYPDGVDGIDNSFGKNLLPIIIGLVPTWPAEVNDYIDSGYFNTMLKLYCLPPSGDAAQLTTKAFGGTDLGYPPLFTGVDPWPVAPELLGDLQDPESSTLVFPNSSVTNDVYDSGPGNTLVLSIPIDYNDETTTIKMTIYSARVRMTLSNDRKTATNGVISGVLNTEEVIDQLNEVAFTAGVCDEAMFQQAINFVRQSSDIMTDGTQDPGQTCDGISVGLNFDMAEVRIGNVGPAAPPDQACP